MNPSCRSVRRALSLLYGASFLAGLIGSVTAAESAPAESASVPPPPPALALAATRLTQDDAIALALQHNQRIKVSDFGRGIARANVLAEYGRFDPSITFRRNYSESELGQLQNLQVSPLTKTDNYAITLEGFSPWGMSYQIGGTAQNQRVSFDNFASNYVTFGGVSVTQPLLRGLGFGANLANLRIAKADRAIADWDYRQTVIDTVTSVIYAYTSLEEARESLRIAEKSRDLGLQLVRDNERRNAVGSISDADVTQARARAASRGEVVLIAQRSVKDAENQLRELIGEVAQISSNAPDIVVDPLASAPAVPADGAADLRRALELRPDYQAAKQGVLKQRATSTLAWNQMLPRVDLVGSFGYNGLDSEFARSRAQVRSEDNRAYSAGVVVSVPLTFAQGRGHARAAKLALRQSQAQLESLEQDIAVLVASAIGQLDTTTQRVAATTKAYELAQQALDAEQKRFRAGASSTFVVLQLQEQLVSVQQSQVRAMADQRRAIANYHRVIGTTLQVHHLRLQ
jgi:outer membrane protein TolC